MIHFNKDREKIIKSIKDELIKYRVNVLCTRPLPKVRSRHFIDGKYVGTVINHGVYAVQLTDKAYNDVISHIGDYENSFADLFTEYELYACPSPRWGRGDRYSAEIVFNFIVKEL